MPRAFRQSQTLGGDNSAFPLVCSLDMSSQATTIVHQIFGGFLRSRGTFPLLLLSLESSVPSCLPAITADGVIGAVGVRG